MTTESKCLRCGGEVIPGKVHAVGRFAFLPRAEIHAAQPRDIGIQATACRECGLIELTADVQKLRS